MVGYASVNQLAKVVVLENRAAYKNYSLKDDDKFIQFTRS
jgi:hypothetical protein